MPKPYVFYGARGSVTSYVSSLSDFYGWFDICEHCLVKIMCVKEEEIKEDAIVRNLRIKVRRPCKEFKQLTYTGSVGDEKT